MERASITHAVNILNRFHNKKIDSGRNVIMKVFYKIYTVLILKIFVTLIQANPNFKLLFCVILLCKKSKII